MAKTAKVIHNGITTIFNITNPNDYIQNSIAETGEFYELGMLEDIENRLSSGNDNYIIDAGAYIGNHSIFFATHCNATVYAFEPYIKSYIDLNDNIHINKLENKIFTHNKALGSKKGTAHMTVADESNAGMNRILSTKPGEIEIVALDDTLQFVKRIDVIKIDVEGMEEEVLQGALKLINMHSPLLYIEAFEKDRLLRIEKLLVSYGYDNIAVFNNTPTYLFKRRRGWKKILAKLKLSAKAI